MAFGISKTTRRLAVVLIIGAAAAAFYLLRGGGGETHYVTAAVTRGAIVRSVSATGTVNPVITVQVGSYVSGPIQALYADFNSPVKAGQLIAKIDPRPFQVKVDEARAAVANAEAQLKKDQADLAYKKLTWERDERLVSNEVVSQDTADNAWSAYQQAVAQVALDRANIQNQKATLEEAAVNLNYTDIISPVDGTVVSRNVDVGQTVAASFQTPTLFLIAKDLTKMQVDTNVSESDIGGVNQGATATFKVDAFPDRTFVGTVGQVRQAPITVQNVVTYDVVVNVPNPELLLKPGMTANVTIVTAKRDNVLRVPVEALRFSPRGAGGAGTGTANLALADHTGADHTAGERAGAAAGEPVGNAARVWKLDGEKLMPVAIRTGLDDGINVEVLGGDLHPGDLVVVDETGTAQRPKTSPLRFPH
jgi:HlyD family secretion protein